MQQQGGFGGNDGYRHATPYVRPGGFNTGFNRRTGGGAGNNLVKVTSNWCYENVNCRTGYYDGMLMVRISDSEDIREKRHGDSALAGKVDPSMAAKRVPEEMSVGCSSTVMLTPRELAMLQIEFMDMLSAVATTSEAGSVMEFPLNDRDSDISDMKCAAAVLVKKGVVIIKGFSFEEGQGVSVSGQVIMDAKQFMNLGYHLLEVTTIMSRYPASVRDDAVTQVMYGVTAETMLNIMQGSFTQPIVVEQLSTFDGYFLKVYFDAYNEVMNFSYSTNILGQVRAKLDELHLSYLGMDLYTLFHQCMNVQGLLVACMREQLTV
jgi:hypothetical protein